MTRRILYRGLAAVLMLLWLCLPSPAQASTCADGSQGPPCAMDVFTCAGTDPSTGNLYSSEPWTFTAPLVQCVQTLVAQSSITMLNAVSVYMQPITAAAITLAIIIFGMRILGGEQELVPKAAGFLLRLGLVYFYSLNMATIAVDIFGVPGGQGGILAQLQNISGHGASPWDSIDQALGSLFGFGAGLTLADGLLGLFSTAISSSLNSPNPGSTLFTPAVLGTISAMLFFFDIVYTYLKAVIVIGFILIISPMLMWLGLFGYTEHFVKKMIDILIMTFITVCMLMAFVNLSMNLVQDTTAQIIADLGGDANVWGKLNQPVASSLNAFDAAQLQGQQNAEGGAARTPQSPVQSNTMPFMSMASDTSVNRPILDFSSGSVSQLMLDFASLFLLSAVLKNTLTSIPEMAQSIAGVFSGVGFHRSLPMKQRLQEGLQDAKVGVGAGIGGVLGGEAGAAVGRGSPIGRALGGLTGAYTGIRAAMMGGG